MSSEGALRGCAQRFLGLRQGWRYPSQDVARRASEACARRASPRHHLLPKILNAHAAGTDHARGVRPTPETGSCRLCFQQGGERKGRLKDPSGCLWVKAENRCDLKVGLLEDSQQAEHIGSSFKRSCDVAELKNIEVTAPIEALPVGLSENASDPALE